MLLVNQRRRCPSLKKAASGGESANERCSCHKAGCVAADREPPGRNSLGFYRRRRSTSATERKVPTGGASHSIFRRLSRLSQARARIPPLRVIATGISSTRARPLTSMDYRGRHDARDHSLCDRAPGAIRRTLIAPPLRIRLRDSAQRRGRPGSGGSPEARRWGDAPCGSCGRISAPGAHPRLGRPPSPRARTAAR